MTWPNVLFFAAVLVVGFFLHGITRDFLRKNL